MAGKQTSAQAVRYIDQGQTYEYRNVSRMTEINRNCKKIETFIGNNVCQMDIDLLLITHISWQICS